VKVVFLEDVPGTAGIGDIKDVKAGFARNYLLPRRLAAPATPAIIKSAEARAVRERRLQDARDAEARAVAERLEGTAYTLTARAGSAGKLFGSIGTADIAAKVAETHTLGLKVLPWTVNEPAQIRAMLDLGADGLISDRPDLARKVMAERGMALPAATPVQP